MSDQVTASAEEARTALRSAHATRRAGARRGAPPLWLSALLALLMGAVFVPVMTGPPWSLLIVIISPASFLVVPRLLRRNGAWRREYNLRGAPIGRAGWVWFIGQHPIILAGMLGAWGLGMSWAAWAAGAALAAWTFAYYELARREGRFENDADAGITMERQA